VGGGRVVKKESQEGHSFIEEVPIDQPLASMDRDVPEVQKGDLFSGGRNLIGEITGGFVS